MLGSSVVFEGDKVLSITGKSIGLYGKVEKIHQDLWENWQRPQYRIIWGEGKEAIEQFLDIDDNGLPIITTPTVLVDRHYEVGTRVVHRDGTQGTILDGQLISILTPGGVSSGKEPKIIVRDVPWSCLKRLPLAQKGDKFIWNDWIGKVGHLTVKVTYKFECDGTTCTIAAEDSHPEGSRAHSYPFPYVGEELPHLSWSYLWDAEWQDNKWFQNLFRYYGKKVIVDKVEVDSVKPKWIRNISTQEKGIYCPLSSETDSLPKILVEEDLLKVQYFKGNEYKNIEERSLCKYAIRGEDVIHFLENGGFADVTAQEYADHGNIDVGYPLELNREEIYTVLHIRNKYLIEWANGIHEYTYVEPTGIIAVMDPSNISLVKPMEQGTVVVERDVVENSRYGVVQWENSYGVVHVKWVTCINSVTDLEESQHSRFDLTASEKYFYLQHLDSSPVVVLKNTPDITAGVVIEVLAEEAKLKLKLPDGSEMFPWIHDVLYVEDDEHCYPCTKSIPADENQVEDNNEKCESIDIEQLAFDSKVSSNGFSMSDDIDKEHSNFGELFIPRMDDYKFLTCLETEKSSLSELSEGIWIQGFEKRPELFTVVIRGLPKTPYEDSLLVFDLCLPHDFPQSLPTVVFRCFGLEINPKIQATGEVILPKMSQVVRTPETDANPCIIKDTLSYIQKEILVEDPYYLVCKNGKNCGDGIVRQHCERYNEFILLNLLAYHQHLVRNLPIHWKSFFMKYYCDTLPKMIDRYETLLFTGDGNSDEPSNVSERGDEVSSSGFYLSLRARLNSIRSSMTAFQ